jgi:hypothetical protein
MTERSLARIARTSFDAPANVTLAEIENARGELATVSLPLKRLEAALNGEVSKWVEDALRPIGAAVDPRLSPEQAKAWRKALLVKLSNLPADVLLAAVRRSHHTAFKFLADVEADVRLQAEAVVKERRLALERLERWQRDLARAQAPALPAPDPKPVTQAEVDRMNALMRSAGLATRWKLEGGEAVMTTGPSEERRSEQSE